MARVEPLQAIRYPQREQSALVAPPYDILGAPEKAALLGRDPHNIVAIDLPHTPPKEAGADAEYEAAGRTFSEWLADGTLRRDKRPTIYVYHQHFSKDGRATIRRMYFARLRLEPFGTGKVFPHEQTFGGPKADRLKLMRTTRCNLSPIFGLFSDPEGSIAALFDPAIGGEPDVVATADGVKNRLWCVSNPTLIEALRGRMETKPVYIADGHHRYGTALNYRDELLAAARGDLPSNHPANYVLAVFCAMEDPGAVILPTHRVLVEPTGLNSRIEPALLDEGFEIHRSGLTRNNIEDALRGGGAQAIGVYDGVGDSFAWLRPTPANGDPLARYEPKRAAAWRRLSYAILHRCILDEIVTPRLCGGRPPVIHYVKNLAGTLDEARRAGGVAFLMQPCTMNELREVCTAGELMPQKTTYFYPKLATGLVINPLG